MYCQNLDSENQFCISYVDSDADGEYGCARIRTLYFRGPVLGTSFSGNDVNDMWH